MITQTRASMAAKSNTALLGVLLMSCVAAEPVGEIQPLLDELHAADILTESQVVELPPSRGGNRFLRGWIPWRHQDTPVLVPHEAGAALQVVNISGQARSLVLETRLLGTNDALPVEIEVAGRALPEIQLTESLAVPLPGHLPQGRIAVHLRFPKAPDPVVLSARLENSLPPGRVTVDEQTIVQSPSSLVDLLRRTLPGDRLVGRFEPPAVPRPGQRFSIVIEQGTRAPRVVFEWSPGWLDRWRGDRTFSIPIGDESDFVRIRLRAEGSGPAATWHDLGINRVSPAVEGSAARAPEIDLPSPPRLVLLYVLDALRADHVDLAGGSDSPTPTLARLARDGVAFERHQSVAPNTIPSTKSLFTGQTFFTQGNSKLAEDGSETLAEVFADAGYRTAAFSGNEFVSDAYGTSRGFDHLAEEVVFRGYADVPGAYNRNAERVQASALAWLDDLGDHDRAFAYLHTMHPHNPYDPPEPLQHRFAGTAASEITATSRALLDIKHNRLEVTAEDQKRLAGLYTGALAYNDKQIALLIDELLLRFPREEILLIVTSDHGEELFDHTGVLHGYTLYREQLQIPLILWWPTHLEPGRVELPTQNLDLHQSLRVLVGAQPSSASEGQPFWPLIVAPAMPRPARPLRFASASSVQGGIFMAQSERYKLIFAPRVGTNYGMGEGRGRGRDAEYLFDLREDPAELVNLAGKTSPEVDWMRSRLTAWMERGLAGEVGADEATLDEATQSRLRALGYLE